MQTQPLSIQALIEPWVRRTPNGIAITAPGRSPLTYQKLYNHINYVRAELNAMGIGYTDRIAIILPNGPEMAVAFVALASCAAIAPLNPDYQTQEFEFYLSDLGAKALVVQSGIASKSIHVAQRLGIPLIELYPVWEAEAGLFTLTSKYLLPILQSKVAQPDDVALLLYTSGTTSKSKRVPLTHANLCSSAYHIQKALELTSDDRCLNIMPLFHIHGLVAAILSSLASGASIVCTPGFFAPRFFEWVKTFCPTWYTAVPTMHQTILDQAAFHSETIMNYPLRFIRSSSAPLPLPVMRGLETTFAVPVIEAYGMTEASHQIASNPLPPYERKAGSVGRAAGPEVAIMDDESNFLLSGQVGEIVIRGPNVMSGYENDPLINQSAFTNDWLRTGDQGFVDTDGYLFIKGRIKEIINRGGEKISPREVDEVLLNHPGVAQAVAFAIPHDKLGEDIAAAVVLHNTVPISEKEIREFASRYLASFKVPSHIVILEEIPKGPTGKIQRINLAKLLNLDLSNRDREKLEENCPLPSTPVEIALAQIWSQVLSIDLEYIDVHKKFLDLGGDSMLATQVIARIRDTFQLDLSFFDFFEMPTVASLSVFITQNIAEET